MSSAPSSSMESEDLFAEADENGARPAVLDLVRRPRIIAALLVVMPMFGQIFYYMKGIPLLWALSKAFPILSLPLALSLFGRQRAPMSRQIIVTFLWMVLVPSFVGVFTFDQNFFVGIAAEVKLLPILYFFSFLAFLLYAKPSIRELTTAFLVCGTATYLALVVLWALIPQSWYNPHYVVGSTPLFSLDNRGDRIRMPMYFGIIAVFYCYRRFLRGRNVWWLLGAAAGFGLTVGIVKTRAMVVGMIGVIAIDSIIFSSPRQRILAALLAPFALAGLLSVHYLGTMFDTGHGSGVSVRLTTALEAINFLGIDPLHWLIGVGTISPTNSDSLISYFNHFFFLADITWLGILFEFGLIGALLIFLFNLRGLLFYRKLSIRIQDDFLGALRDYIVYVLLISPLYPPTLTPGETAVAMAIFVYVWQSLSRDLAQDPAQDLTSSADPAFDYAPADDVPDERWLDEAE